MTGEKLRRVILTELYGSRRADQIGDSVEQILAQHRRETAAPTTPWSRHDAWLITYADQFQTETEQPLRTLDRFLRTHFDGQVVGRLWGTQRVRFGEIGDRGFV